jgi:CRISPR-associated endonuclease Csn1
LFHLNQRRGFKSNRKTDKSGDADDSGKIKSAAGKLAEAIKASGSRTLGEYLYMRRIGKIDGQALPVRARLNGVGAKAEYELYPTRDMLAAEFDCLWESQKRHHGKLLTDVAKAEILDILLYQRPLKPVDPGRCTFYPEEKRAPWALPSAQRARIYQELGQLEKIDPESQKGIRLTLEERDAIAEQLFQKEKRTFDQIRKLLKLNRDWLFNLESSKRSFLNGDKTAYRLGNAKLFGQKWHGLSLDEQDSIVERLLNDEDEAAVTSWLQDSYGLSAEAAEKVANCNLPDGYGNLGRTALSQINEQFLKANLVYSEACQQAGFKHSDFRTGEVFDRLPYYGKMLERHVGFGSGNPTDRQEVRYGAEPDSPAHERHLSSTRRTEADHRRNSARVEAKPTATTTDSEGSDGKPEKK